MAETLLKTVGWATDVLSRDPRQLFHVVRVLLSDVRRVTGMDAAELYLADPAQTCLMLSGYSGQDSGAFFERSVFAFGAGFPGLAAAGRGAVETAELGADTRFLRPGVPALGYRGFVGLPLLLPHAVVGVLTLATREPARLGAARAQLAFCAPLLAASLYAVMTSLGERTLERVRQARTPRDRALILLEDTLDATSALRASLRPLHGEAVETHPQQMVPCQANGCPAGRGQVCVSGVRDLHCAAMPDTGTPGALHTVCLPVWDGGEVRAVASVQFPVRGAVGSEAAAPLLWLSRFAAGELGLSPAPAEAPAPAPLWLEIETFGAFRVRRGGEWLAPTDFQRRQAYQLFKLLVTRWGRPLHADELCAALWPGEEGGEKALARLHVTLNALRQVVEPRGERGQVIVRDGPSYRFAPTLPYRLDAEEFERRVREADAQQGAAAVAGYERALRLYRGHYLEDDPYADLFALERDYLRELAVRSLLRCAEEQEAAGHTQAALASYSHLLTLDPLHFEAHEAMIDVLVRRGQLGDARARWERYAQAYGGQPPRPAP
ncbi:BTAD domain-containing putative transcriptional regulator [Deinococcus sp. MIMF12]|uniref:BTAD domain-containing putative transcriptional regulator n=1 Tax=Deinococcus rhizophilus TaxID=3049544 RepID=A0ABT7JHC9_9DEIO|nr:BTAD domain-containing putative transcriptional regulator [Deinococcus rhizophilus]MDL2344458.1 BTAD domain-containing putative transcriptional regulator [Deinococcus rhizophilus]